MYFPRKSFAESSFSVLLPSEERELACNAACLCSPDSHADEAKRNRHISPRCSATHFAVRLHNRICRLTTFVFIKAWATEPLAQYLAFI